MSGSLRAIWPLLMVRDLERSVAFYSGQLGFRVIDEALSAGRRYWCRLERDGLSLMLQQGEDAADGERPGRGVVLYFVCDDAEALHAEFASRGVAVSPPQVAYYGMRQLFVPDPDGYEVCFESLVVG